MTITRRCARRGKRLALFIVVALLLPAAGLLAAPPDRGIGLLDGGPITPRRMVILAGIAGIAALIVGSMIFGAVSDDGKMRELQRAPGFDLRFPNGSLLDEVSMPSSGNIGADHEFIYGTNATPEEIVAFFDSELGKIGYAPTPQTPDRIMAPYQNRVLRQYQNGPFTYRLYLLPLPDRVNGKWHYDDFAHTLYAKISN
jgi:hypothetical protein